MILYLLRHFKDIKLVPIFVNIHPLELFHSLVIPNLSWFLVFCFRWSSLLSGRNLIWVFIGIYTWIDCWCIRVRQEHDRKLSEMKRFMKTLKAALRFIFPAHERQKLKRLGISVRSSPKKKENVLKKQGCAISCTKWLSIKCLRQFARNRLKPW